MKRAALILLCLTLLAGLAAFAYAGTFSRYWADDYCYSAAVKDTGLLQAAADWYRTSGNRLSTLFAVALSETAGPRAIQALPALLLALFAAAWAMFLRVLTTRLFARPPGLLLTAALALLLTFYTFLLAPDRTQTLYWRMGSLHYTLPVALLMLNLSLLLHALDRPRWLPWAALAGMLLAAFSAGLSETFAAMQAVLFAALVALLSLWRPGPRRAGSFWLALLPLMGTLAVMALMASAPANAWRQDVMPPPDNLLDVPLYALRYAADFIFFALRGAPLPFAVFLASVLGLGLLLPLPQLSARGALAGTLGSLLAAYLLVVASFAPSAFAGLAYPAGRAQMPAHAALLSGLAAAAFFLAAFVRGRLFERALSWQTIAALALLLAGALYPVRALSVPRADAAALSARAARWDARDAQILQARAAGANDLRVRQTDVVQGLEDLGPDPAFWINRCAAVYYGVHTITAEAE